MSKLINKEESFQIIGSAMEVHNILGSGFLEGVYQEAMEIELSLRAIPFEREPYLDLYFKGHLLTKKFQPDFLCYNKVIVEAKACSGLTTDHMAQTLNYLNCTDCRLGLLINFGQRRLEYRRIVL